jgi:protein associated with RNAse G/E
MPLRPSLNGTTDMTSPNSSIKHPTATTTTTTTTTNNNNTQNGNTIILLTHDNCLIDSASQLRPVSSSAQSTNNSIVNDQILHIGPDSNVQNKEWHFLQTAISEAGLGDFYHQNTCTSSTDAHKIQQINHDLNIEAILKMQSELLDQQKELKSIEMDTLEQLKQLHTNISRLARKFDTFETSVVAVSAATTTATTSAVRIGTDTIVNQQHSSAMKPLPLTNGIFIKSFL